ncbi:hypothetical protein F4604DRAFT_1914990 [Suillus subluteus]|nr:hypothetical protein F4604DRAFT_1914990 [Suillus subluteus]
MAPRKWTSPEQEEWLSPWYEKYHTKQSDKAKNWANFFTDLLGEWLEQFPEPRPATLPVIGPLTMDEITIMDQAEADRKKKLENCFKNSIGATKTGRQAKTEAANVFHAVLKSVTECKKPSRTLQEVKAYSKLYYQKRIKSIIDNKLKAAAEELRAEDKVLTNGKHVAIVKEETRNLYKVETSEIKAEVRRYIEDAKTCRDMEKERMWSEDDYARNLEKLAAMVNKFLKGLADTTGFSFSLLAGGPSPELSGLINVYRQVNHADLWNPALTFGIKFSSDAAAGLKARIGDVEGLNDDDDNGSDPPSSGVELGNQNDDTFGHVTSSPLTTSVTPPDSDSVNVETASNVNLPENSTDINNWSNLDDSFWEDLTAQLYTFEASGGNPNLPPLPPYPHGDAAAILNSPSAPTTTTPSSSELPAHTFPKASMPILVPRSSPTSLSTALSPTPHLNDTQSLPTLASQSLPTSPSTALSPTSTPSLPHGSPAVDTSLILPPTTTAGQQRRSQPPALECAHPRRTGRVCVPSSHNVIANSIGENLPTNAATKRGGKRFDALKV